MGVEDRPGRHLVAELFDLGVPPRLGLAERDDGDIAVEGLPEEVLHRCPALVTARPRNRGRREQLHVDHSIVADIDEARLATAVVHPRPA